MDKVIAGLLEPARHAEAKRALYVLLMITAVESFIVTAANDRPNMIVMTMLALLSNFFAFLWYCRDSDALGYRRSLGLNVAVIALGPLGIAYYLLRSRHRGMSLRAIMRLLGFVCLLAGASVLGTVTGALVA